MTGEEHIKSEEVIKDRVKSVLRSCKERPLNDGSKARIKQALLSGIDECGFKPLAVGMTTERGKLEISVEPAGRNEETISFKLEL